MVYKLDLHRNLVYTGEMRILDNMMSSARTFTLTLIMLALPMQGTLAAIMPLCAQAKNTSANTSMERETHDPIATAAPCSQHDIANHEQPASNDSTADDMTFNLPCDGAVCHISSSGPPPATSPLNLAGGFSYSVPSDSRFASLALQQPQRPPLP